MHVDFIEGQDKARRITGSLIFYFVLGMLGITFMLCLAIVSSILLTLSFFPTMWDSWVVKDPWFFITVLAMGIILFILLCSRLKIAQLRKGGGQTIAKMLGGRLLQAGTRVPLERRLFNVVDEMAIASGIPVPVVYVLPLENGINAFAAGFDPHYAVLGVTKGSLENLSRDELQGIIGHEFSHILNGDMRLNLQLIGWIHGITVIGYTGSWLFYRSVGAKSGDSSVHEEIQAVVPGMLLGAVLMSIGYLGTFFGNIIKASVCRQREYLADASAIEFTRNPAGLAGALKKIGGLGSGSELTSPNATVASHMYFGQGVLPLFERLLATHPSLNERIRRIDPCWTGTFEEVTWTVRKQIMERADVEFSGVSFLADPDLPGNDCPTGAIMQRSTALELAYVQYNHQVLYSLPKELFNAARFTKSAPALFYALLVSVEKKERQACFDLLSEHCDVRTFDFVQRLVPQIALAGTSSRIPLIDVALPQLRNLDKAGYTNFKDMVKALVGLDRRVGLFEWMFLGIIRRHLDPFFYQSETPEIEPQSLQFYADSCAVLLEALSCFGERDRTMARRMFARGAENLRIKFSEPRCAGLSLKRVDQALGRLENLHAKSRRRLINACILCICENNEVSVTEGELLRAIVDRLGCPTPPLLPGQPLG